MDAKDLLLLDKLLSKVSVDDATAGPDKSKRVELLNELAEVVRSSLSSYTDLSIVRKLTSSLQYTLLSGVKEVRAGALRILRYILLSEDVFEVMLEYCIDVLVIRSMDISSHRDVERIQALRFIQQVILAAPEIFPLSFGLALVSMATGDSDTPDNFSWSCVGLLSQLMAKNVSVAVGCGAVRGVCWCILGSQNLQLTESVVMVLLHLLNKPSTRKYLRPGSELLSLLAPITDIHYQHTVDNWEDAKKIHFLSNLHGSRDDDFKLKVESSCLVVKTILSSWPGVMLMASCMSQCFTSSLSAVIKVLPLIGVSAQVEVIEMLYCVYQLRVPKWTDSFVDAMASIDTRRPLQEWSLSEGFVAEEARMLLPPTTTGRPDIMKCHLALLLSVMVDLGLFDSIAHICLGENGHLATKAAILLGELLHLANTLLPEQYYQNIQSLPIIVTAGMDFSNTQKRDRANAIINCLDNFHKMKKSKQKPSSLYLNQLVSQGIHHKQVPNSLIRDIDDGSLSTLIKSTLVTTGKDYKQWDWNLLQSMLRVEPYCYRKVEESLKVKFFKRLHEFYKPDSKQFSNISYSTDASWKYSGVGCLLIRFLAKDEDLVIFLTGIISDIVSELDEISSGQLPAHFSPYSLEHTLSRDYFLFLGCVSHHRPSILSHCKAYGPMFGVCDIDMRVDLHKLILSSLDFSRDRSSRSILSKMLTAGASQTRLYATKMLRVLLRSKVQVFKSWGMEMLTTQLYDPNEDIAAEALDILDEACEEESYLISLLQFNPALLHLSEKGVSFLTRFFSTRKGLSRMKQLGYLETELSRWHTAYNEVYVKVVEEKLTQAFTTYRKSKDDEFVKRNITGDVARPPALVPVHLYSQLACHTEGCEILETTGYIQDYSTLIRNSIEVCEDVTKVKAAVWAVAHIGTSVDGLDLLMDEGVVHDLVRMAESNAVLTVRGTCFYALCLISRTVHGADVLQDLGWISLRHAVNVSVSSTQLSSSDVTSRGQDMSPLDKLDTLFQALDVKTSTEHTPQSDELTNMKDKRMLANGPLQKFSLNKRRISLSFTSRHDQESQEKDDNSLVKVQTSSTRDILDVSNRPVVPALQTGGERRRVPSPLQFSTSAASHPYVTISRVSGRKLAKAITSRHDSLSTSPSSAAISFYRPNYVGICLPRNQLSILQIPEIEFVGAQADYVPPEVDQPADEGLKHIPTNCLECRWLLSSGPTASQNGLDEVDGSPSKEEREAVRKETLRIVTKMSSDVASNANKQGLKMLFSHFPWAAQDVCLYSRVLHLLSSYRFTLSHRRFIQDLFRKCKFQSIFQQRGQIQTLSMNQSDLLPPDLPPSPQ